MAALGLAAALLCLAHAVTVSQVRDGGSFPDMVEVASRGAPGMPGQVSAPQNAWTDIPAPAAFDVNVTHARKGTYILVPLCNRTNCTSAVSACQSPRRTGADPQKALSPRQPDPSSFRCHRSLFDPGKPSPPPRHIPQTPLHPLTNGAELPARYRQSLNRWYVRVVDLRHPQARREVETEILVGPPGRMPLPLPDMPVVEPGAALWPVFHIFPSWILRDFALTQMTAGDSWAGEEEDLEDLWRRMGEHGEVSGMLFGRFFQARCGEKCSLFRVVKD